MAKAVKAAPRRGEPRRFGELPALTERIDGHFADYADGHITLGKTPGPDDIQMATNDYLSLAQDQRIIDSQVKALQTDNSDIYMSGVYIQYLDGQRAFERKMANFLGVEDTVLCQSGYAANEGLIQSLADQETPVYLDFYAHASLWQGAYTAHAPMHAFRHNSAEHLRVQIKHHGPGVVVVDAIYSTLGDLCDLPSIADVCDETGSILVVDESHAIGAIGRNGAGLVAALDMADRVPYRVFSLSKAFVGRGGVVAASARFTEYFRYESRPAIFSSAVLPWEIARFSKTLDIVKRETWRREKLNEGAEFLRNGLGELGYNVDTSQSQIIPLVAGSEANTVVLRDALEQNGVFGSVFCPPATPKNKSLVRLCVNQGLSGYDLERVVDVCRKIRDKVNVDDWPANKRKRVQSKALQAAALFR